MPADLPPVVITRPRGQADALAAAVTALGRQAVLLPLLEIEPLAAAGQAALRQALAQLAEYALVAFVSPNAIDAAFAHIDAWPPQVALAVLGDASRASLAAHGIAGDRYTIYSPADGARNDSEGLMAALKTVVLAGRRALIVRGESGRELIADGLRAAGAEVTLVPAYRRRVPPLDEALAAQLRALLAQECEWVITSSEALRGLFAMLAHMDASRAASADPCPDATFVAKMQQQRLIVPHARIAETAQGLGALRITLAGPGHGGSDGAVLAALQSRA